VYVPSVLLVDDDKDIIRMAQAILENSFYNVKSAGDVLAALELLRTYTFDVVISDANMPHYSGFDLIKTIRHEDKWRSMSVAMLTGRKEKQDIERAIRLGIDDYIIKPIDPLIFLKKVDTLVASRPQGDPKPHIWLPQTGADVQGQVKFRMTVVSVSEEGLVIQGKSPLNRGEIVEFECPIFDEIGIQPPQARIFSSSETGNGNWESRALFFAITDLTLQKIRAWMKSNATKSIRQAG